MTDTIRAPTTRRLNPSPCTSDWIDCVHNVRALPEFRVCESESSPALRVKDVLVQPIEGTTVSR